MRRPARHILTRLVARLLIKLLVIGPFPSHVQAAAALFPVSMLWPLVGLEEGRAGVAEEVEILCRTTDFKVGHFSLSFADLDVPVAGIPIRVTRTYDSRDKTQGRLRIRMEARSQQREGRREHPRRAAMAGDQEPGLPADLLPPVGQGQGRHRHLLRWPHLAVRAGLTPQCQTFLPIQEVSISYRPVPGTNTLGTLVPIDGTDAAVVGAWPSTFAATPMQLFDLDNFNILDPSRYKLVMPEGIELTLDQIQGIKSIKDTERQRPQRERGRHHAQQREGHRLPT